jgi:hypothetical protein
LNIKASVSIIASFLIVTIIYSSIYAPNSEFEIKGIEFGAMLDLTNDNATITAIGSYMINEDREHEEPFLMVTSETLEKVRISIDLGAIKNSTDVSILRNQTELNGLVRQFEVLTLDVFGYEEQQIHGWIDQERNVYVSFVINWYYSAGTGSNEISITNTTQSIELLNEISESFELPPIGSLPTKWVTEQEGKHDSATITNETSYKGTQSLHIHETGGDLNSTRIQIKTPPFQGSDYLEIKFEMKIKDGRGVIQVNREDGQQVFMLNCFAGSHWQYWTDYGAWPILNNTSAFENIWHDIRIIVDSVDSRFLVSVDGVHSGWIPSHFDWDAIRYVTFRGNDNYPGDYWIDNLSVSKTEYNSDWALPVIPALVPGSPSAKARDILIQAVGEDYFSKYFVQWKAEINRHEPENWYTAVGYFYYLKVDDYTTRREISIYFNQQDEMIRTDGVPSDGNLMPFFLSKDDAITLALPYIVKSYVEVGADIYYIDETHNDVPIDRYVWVVQFYHSPRKSNSGTLTSVYIDPNTRQVYDTLELGWSIVY